MSIKITWANPDQVDTINLYRSNEKFGIDTLPVEPYQTFTDNELEYDDKNVVRNELYYYMVEKVDGTNKSYTPLMARAYFPDSGPGKTELELGDWFAGYFGKVNQDEFYTPSELLVEINNLVDGGFKYPNNGDADWRKFIFNGKVLFIPLAGITTSSFGFSWDFLYEKGLVYGIDGNGYHPADKQVNQSVRVTLDGLTYQVRLMRLTEIEQGLQHTEILSQAGRDEDLKVGEVANTWFRLFFKRAAEWVNNRVDNEPYVAKDARVFMELSSNDTVTLDGNTTTNVANLTSIAYTANHTNSWTPVLELIINPT